MNGWSTFFLSVLDPSLPILSISLRWLIGQNLRGTGKIKFDLQDVPILVPLSDRITIIKWLLNNAEQDFDPQKAKVILKLFKQVFCIVRSYCFSKRQIPSNKIIYQLDRPTCIMWLIYFAMSDCGTNIGTSCMNLAIISNCKSLTLLYCKNCVYA